jgi:hypothetical protein
MLASSSVLRSFGKGRAKQDFLRVSWPKLSETHVTSYIHTPALMVRLARLEGASFSDKRNAMGGETCFCMPTHPQEHLPFKFDGNMKPNATTLHRFNQGGNSPHPPLIIELNAYEELLLTPSLFHRRITEHL